MVRLRSHDQGFVAAPPRRVYELLADPASYPGWWPGAGADGGGVSLPLGRRPRAARPERERAEIGLYLMFGDESLEWYLEPFDDGTIVNAFLDVAPTGSARRASRRMLRMRAALRTALVGLKRRLEARV